MPAATAPRVSRAILEDRWNGAVYELEVGDEWTPLMNRLDKTIRQFYEALTRTEWTGEMAPTPERPALDASGEVHEAVHEAFRRTLLDEIDRRGLAR